ncbi:MAG: glycosyltransferase family 4 protein [Actinomycetota bacterium]
MSQSDFDSDDTSPPSRPPRVLGVSWGDPDSVKTYSGVPKRLFRELSDLGILVGVSNAKLLAPLDLWHGIVDWPRSAQARRPRMNPLWRYMPDNIDRLSQRFRNIDAPDHDAVMQFGVAGLAPEDKAILAHVEIPVETAICTEVFAASYGFSNLSNSTIEQAIKGERRFLDRCDLIWTNTPWTASLLESQGQLRRKIRVWPPPCGVADPGEIERCWLGCHLLFIGKDWQRKGGDLLVSAFGIVKRSRPEATLTVIGCSPEIKLDGVEVLGFLRQDVPEQAAAFHRALTKATIFCMPSAWESTGLVYFEAALYGLPTIMLTGQERDKIFGTDMAVHVHRADPVELAASILDLSGSPDLMESMGRIGRRRVLEHHTFPVVAEKVAGWLGELAR